MQETIQVAAVQLDVCWQAVDENRERMVALTDRAAAEGAELILFPELANTGYFRFGDVDFISRYVDLAEPVPGPTTEALGAVARRRGAYVLVGLLQAHPVVPATVYNSVVLIGPNGRVLGVHHKMHLGMDEKKLFYPGDTAHVYRTELGNLAMMVCYDALMPELARVLALKGAEIIGGVFAAPGWLPGSNRRLEHVAGTRARENGLYFILCNRVGRQEDWQFIGGTTIAAPTGEILSQDTTFDEAVVRATLTRELLVRTRAHQTIFRDRRPELYRLLCESLSAAPLPGAAAEESAHGLD